MSKPNTKLVHHIDCPGGGQVWADGTTLYVGHMHPPAGTTIFDVADPKAPRLLATIAARPGRHSHKVRVANGHMVINQESIGGPAGEGGIDIYDVARPSEPKLISRWRTVDEVCTVSILMADTPIYRPPSKAISEISS
jgi:hypothetical protein